jgi:hypothetical protein
VVGVENFCSKKVKMDTFPGILSRHRSFEPEEFDADFFKEFEWRVNLFLLLRRNKNNFIKLSTYNYI